MEKIKVYANELGNTVKEAPIINGKQTVMVIDIETVFEEQVKETKDKSRKYLRVELTDKNGNNYRFNTGEVINDKIFNQLKSGKLQCVKMVQSKGIYEVNGKAKKYDYWQITLPDSIKDKFTKKVMIDFSKPKIDEDDDEAIISWE